MNLTVGEADAFLKAGRSGWVGDIKTWIDGSPDSLVATA